MCRNKRSQVLATSAAILLIAMHISSAATWQNPTNASDVDNSGVVAPRDALIDINYLNSTGPGFIPSTG